MLQFSAKSHQEAQFPMVLIKVLGPAGAFAQRPENVTGPAQHPGFYMARVRLRWSPHRGIDIDRGIQCRDGARFTPENATL